MVELVDTRDLKSLALKHGGSSPPNPTTLLFIRGGCLMQPY